MCQKFAEDHPGCELPSPLPMRKARVIKFAKEKSGEWNDDEE